MSTPVSSDVPGGQPTGLEDRERDVETLDRAVARALDGEGGVVVIEGPAGIGKSALLAALRTRPGLDRATVLTARAGELEQEFAYGVARQLLEATLGDSEERARRLQGAAAAAAPVFHATGDAPTEEAGSFATLHGLYWLTADLAADTPVVLLVDDLHWCDAASLRFLTYLARRLDGLPILVATTLRSGEDGADPALIAELLQDPATEELTLAPLTPQATATLVRARLGADAQDAFCAACHDASAGNPLLLRQLLRALENDRIAPVAEEIGTVLEVGPRAVSRTVLVRLARLPPAAISLARGVSILGDGADLPTAAEFAGVELRAANSATGPLSRAEILRPDLPLEFVHPLIRQAIYLDQPPGERAAGHARAAEVLHQRGAPVDQIAKQLLLSLPKGRDWAADVLHTAGLDALGRGAPESAVAYMERALAEPPAEDRRGRLLYDLGRAEALNDGAAAVEHLEAALFDLREPLIRSQAAFALPRLLILLGRPEEAADMCRRFRAELSDEDVDARYSLMAFGRMAAIFTGEQLEIDDLELPVGQSDAPGAKRLLAITAFERCLTGDGADEVVPLALEALADDILMPVDDTFFIVAALRALVEAGRPEAMDYWDAAMADAHRRGSLASSLGVHLWRGYTLLRHGELEEAEASLSRADAARREWGDSSVGRLFQGAVRIEIQRESGNLVQARAILEPLMGTAPPLSEPKRLLDAATIALLLAEGRAEEALTVAEAFSAEFAHVTNPALCPRRSLQAQALAALGRDAEAGELLEDELRAARAWGAPATTGRTLAILGTLRRDEALLREAVELTGASPARLEHAKALLALGRMVRLDRRPSEARDPLREAYELATRCGAPAVADAARAELHASGARPRTAALSGAASLTASERRVADLAADGRTNRDIAQELYVTAKTVEVHLSSTYRKLGISSRRELPAALTA